MENITFEELTKISYQNIKKILRKIKVDQAKDLMKQTKDSLDCLYSSLDNDEIPLNDYMIMIGRVKKYEIIYRYLYERTEFVDYEKEFREDIRREKEMNKKESWW